MGNVILRRSAGRAMGGVEVDDDAAPAGGGDPAGHAVARIDRGAVGLDEPVVAAEDDLVANRERDRAVVTVLGQIHRFRDPVYRDAAELLRDHQAVAAVEVLRAKSAVSDDHATPVDAWMAMVDDWLTHRDHGHAC